MNEQTMTADEQLVWNALSGCKGKAMAVTQYHLAEACGMESRRVRRVIESLIYKYRKPIGSSPIHAHGGYFVIADPKEAQEATDRYKRQAVKILQRAAVIMRISEQELFKQMQLEMEFDHDT